MYNFPQTLKCLLQKATHDVLEARVLLLRRCFISLRSLRIASIDRVPCGGGDRSEPIDPCGEPVPPPESTVPIPDTVPVPPWNCSWKKSLKQEAKMWMSSVIGTFIECKQILATMFTISLILLENIGTRVDESCCCMLLNGTLSENRPNVECHSV